MNQQEFEELRIITENGIIKKRYSGLIVDPDISTYSFFDKIKRKKEIRKNIKKIKMLPEYISEKILEVPQFEIFYQGFTPYYITQNDLEKKEFPKNDDGYYYDPVMDTEAYKMIKESVEKKARKIYEEDMIKKYGTTNILGAYLFYDFVEATVLYEDYGIFCFNSLACFNARFDDICVD